MTQARNNDIEIGFDQESKDRFLADIEAIRARLIAVAREQERVLFNAEKIRREAQQ